MNGRNLVAKVEDGADSASNLELYAPSIATFGRSRLLMGESYVFDILRFASGVEDARALPGP